MNIISLVGSLREESFNYKLVRTMKERNKESFDLSFGNIGNLDLYNQDDEDNPPEPVLELKKKIKHADAVLISTPEYNWSIPGSLKNALDWLSRGEKVMNNKPILIVGVSTGMMGTIRAQLHLRQILTCPGLDCKVFTPAGNEVLVNLAEQKFDESGNLSDENTLLFLDKVIKNFTDWVNKINN